MFITRKELEIIMSTLIDAANAFAESLKAIANSSGNTVDQQHLSNLDQAVASLQADDKSYDEKINELGQALNIVTSALNPAPAPAENPAPEQPAEQAVS